MELKRMDQVDVARALNVSRSAVNAWMNDRAWPRNRLAALEELLGVDLLGAPEERPYRPISRQLRREIEEALPGDIEAQRRVIGLLDGTLVWPEPVTGTEPGEGDPPEQAAAR